MYSRSDCEANGGVYHANGECNGKSSPVEYGQSKPETMPIYEDVYKDTKKENEHDTPAIPSYDGSDESLYVDGNKRMMAKKLFTPTLIGLYSIAGLYIGRALSGTSRSLPLSTVALVASTSAASALVAPMLSPFVVCPNSASAPLVDAAISSAISFELIMLSSSTEDAVRFIPVQMLSYIGGVFMAPKVKSWLRKSKML